MTYNAPELVSVGAAQNLVLGDSVDPALKNDFDCKKENDMDQPAGDTYDEIATW